MQLISKLNKGIRFYYVIDIFSKSAWVITLKDQKRITITNAFRKIFKRIKLQIKKIWVDQGTEF